MVETVLDEAPCLGRSSCLLYCLLRELFFVFVMLKPPSMPTLPSLRLLSAFRLKRWVPEVLSEYDELSCFLLLYLPSLAKYSISDLASLTL